MIRLFRELRRTRVPTRAREGPGVRAADLRRGIGPRSDGYSLTEVFVVVGILTLIMAATVVAWGLTRGRAETRAAARLTRVFMHRARMSSIFEGVNHFLVLDPINNRLEIYADTGTVPGSFDDADPRMARTVLSSSVNLLLPTQPSPLVSPLDSSTITSSWDLPTPDSSARWGTQLMGVMTTPTGLIQSAAATPITIGSGMIVFSNGEDQTSAVGLRGREGSVRAFELFNGQWKEL